VRAGDGDLLDRQAGGQVVHERAAGCAERGNAMTVQNRADGSRRPGRPQVAVIGAGLAGLHDPDGHEVRFSPCSTTPPSPPPAR
jgi:NADPH-dependent 2,4-dienoyl-CoA reductase/sulfur reductase-like enzyme